MFKFDTIVVRLVSMKDLGHVYEVHLRNLKDTIRVLETQTDLEKARLELLELHAMVVNKQREIYDNNHREFI